MRLVLAGVFFLVLGACSGYADLDRRVEAAGLHASSVPGGPFLLRVYARDEAPGPLHVYLEGDGRPWIDGGRRVARNPHGSHPIAFEMMLRDPAPSLYVERPCYRILRQEDPCDPHLWTHGRYSPAVVSSLADALERSTASRELVLIGYSGGGVLARLLAARLDRVVALVTVAANLDLAAWTTLHGYEPLEGSLDPADAPPLPASIRQVHLTGSDDPNVPPGLAVRSLRREVDAELRRIEGFGHRCCWVERWPELLESLGFS